MEKTNSNMDINKLQFFISFNAYKLNIAKFFGREKCDTWGRNFLTKILKCTVIFAENSWDKVVMNKEIVS